MTHDAATKQVVLTAGRSTGTTITYPITTWAWNGSTWAPI
jgi:hypothetical protein